MERGSERERMGYEPPVTVSWASHTIPVLWERTAAPWGEVNLVLEAPIRRPRATGRERMPTARTHGDLELELEAAAAASWHGPAAHPTTSITIAILCSQNLRSLHTNLQFLYNFAEMSTSTRCEVGGEASIDRAGVVPHKPTNSVAPGGEALRRRLAPSDGSPLISTWISVLATVLGYSVVIGHFKNAAC